MHLSIKQLKPEKSDEETNEIWTLEEEEKKERIGGNSEYIIK